MMVSVLLYGYVGKTLHAVAAKIYEKNM